MCQLASKSVDVLGTCATPRSKLVAASCLSECEDFGMFFAVCYRWELLCDRSSRLSSGASCQCLIAMLSRIVLGYSMRAEHVRSGRVACSWCMLCRADRTVDHHCCKLFKSKLFSVRGGTSRLRAAKIHISYSLLLLGCLSSAVLPRGRHDRQPAHLLVVMPSLDARAPAIRPPGLACV